MRAGAEGAAEARDSSRRSSERRWRDDLCGRSGDEGSCVVTVATTNVCTLGVSRYDSDVRTEIGVSALGRAQLLEKQFSDSALDIVCVQEGRIDGDQLRAGVFYDMHVAGSRNGSYGSQVWVRRGLACDTIMSTAVSPRIMAVAMNVSVGRGSSVLAVMSVHAPILDAAESDKDMFWDQLLQCVSGVSGRWPDATVVLGIDANARVGMTASPYIGLCQPDVENTNGISGTSLRSLVCTRITRSVRLGTRGLPPMAPQRALTPSVPHALLHVIAPRPLPRLT